MSRLTNPASTDKSLTLATPETWAPLMAQGCRRSAKPRIRRERVNLLKAAVQWRTIAYIVVAGCASDQGRAAAETER